LASPQRTVLRGGLGKFPHPITLLDVADPRQVTSTPLQDHVDPRALIRPLWRRRWMIVAIVVLATVATYVYYGSRPKQYTATTSIFVRQSPLDQFLYGGSSGADPARTTVNQATLLDSRPVATAVVEQIHYPGSPDALLGNVQASASAESDFVKIKAKGATAEQAAAIANGFAQQFIALRSTDARKQVTAAADAAREKLRALPPGATVGAQRSALRTQIRELTIAAALPSANAQQVADALRPHFPSYPRPLRTAVFGLALSLVLAIALAFALERFDRRIKDIFELEELFPQPLLGALPRSGDRLGGAQGAGLIPRDLKEAVRRVRSNVLLGAIDNPLKTLLITSALPGEGKTTLARNLGLTLAESGQSVAIIDADFRRPALAPTLGAKARPGLTDVLIGAATLDDAVQRLIEPSNDGSVSAAIEGAGARGSVDVVAAGPTPPDPPTVTASRRLHELLAEIASQHDIVIIDSAPLLSVSDSLPLLSEVDGVLLVSRLGILTRDAARRLQQTLQRAPRLFVVGFVANDVASTAFNEGYGYYETNVQAEQLISA
jgi:succinoglycan biosynthesis transport protein ExoP